MSIGPATRNPYFHDPFPLDFWEASRFPALDHHFPALDHHFPALDHHFRHETASLPLVSARIDWKVTPKAHILKVDLPGLRKEHVKVDLENGRVLKIIGETFVETEDRNDRWHRIERSGRRFVRSFVLPDDSNPHEMEARMEEGVLTIKVPRVETRHGHHGITHIPIH